TRANKSRATSNTVGCAIVHLSRTSNRLRVVAMTREQTRKTGVKVSNHTPTTSPLTQQGSGGELEEREEMAVHARLVRGDAGLEILGEGQATQRAPGRPRFLG